MHSNVVCDERDVVPTSSVRRVRRAADAAAIFDTDVNVLVLRRELATGIALELDDKARMPSAPTILLAVEASARGRQLILEQFRAVPALARDIAACVELFADLTDASLVGIRLAHLTAAMCPRLHVDRVDLRLVVTYRGLGTEYVDGARFDRRLLAVRPVANDNAHDALEAVVTERAQAADIVLLKGESWPANVGRGAVHRSPFASHAQPRTVLTLDSL
jgi:hypothetical protein